MKLTPKAVMATAIWAAVAVAATVVLMQRSGNSDALGIVTAREHNITHAAGGTLAEVLVHEGSVVKRGDIIARLDTKALELSIAAARAALDHAGSSVGAATVDIDRASFEAQRALRRDVSEVESELVDARATMQRDTAELKSLESELAREREALANQLVRGDRAAELQLRVATARQTAADWPRRMQSLEARLGAARQALAKWSAEHAQFEGQRSRIDKLKPLQNEISQRQVELTVSEQDRERAVIRAPADGVVTAVRLRAGDVLRGSDPVAVLVEQPSATLVGYADERSADKLAAGMAVEVRRRSGMLDPTTPTVKGTVATVSGVVTLRPQRLWPSAQFAQWGREVHVNLPAGAPLMPGEVVELHFTGNSQASFLTRLAEGYKP